MTPVILQARVGSRRYPGKMLEDIAGRTLLERVLMRIEMATGRPEILAIPDDEANIPLERIAEMRGWKVFRGSESDVLKRYADTLRANPCDAFIRATGDNPLVEPRGILAVRSALERSRVARTHGFPSGTGVEGAATEDLLAADREAVDPAHREHVMPYLYSAPDRFRVELVPAPPELRRTCRLTVDDAEDIARTRGIFSHFGDYPELEAVLAFLGAS